MTSPCVASSSKPVPPLPAHSRAEQEVIFVQSGTLEVTWADGKLIMGAGDTLTVPVGLVHGFRNPASADAIAFVIRGAAAPAAPQFAGTIAWQRE